MNRYIARAFFCLCFLGCPALNAGQFSVSPVSVEITAPARATLITVTNNDTRALTVQFRVFSWSQSENQDHLSGTTDVVVSPPIATVEPGAEQVVRIVSHAAQGVSMERAFRLLVDELPTRQEQANGVVDVLLRYSLPVFLSPDNTVAGARPVWSARLEEDELVLEVANEGSRRVRIADLLIETEPGTGEAVFGGGLLGYVLAGSERKWRARLTPEQMKSLNNPISLFALTDAGEISVTVPLSMEP